jgi:hypothetical protein
MDWWKLTWTIIPDRALRCSVGYSSFTAMIEKLLSARCFIFNSPWGPLPRFLAVSTPGLGKASERSQREEEEEEEEEEERKTYLRTIVT